MKVFPQSFSEFPKKLLGIIFIIPFVVANRSTDVNQEQFQGGNYNVSWNFSNSSASSEIEFEVRVKTTGYVALGLSRTNTSMKELDIFVGGVNAGGSNYHKDYYATGTGNPSEDQQQDTTLVNASESNGVTMVRWKRKLNTGDANDLQIKPGDPVYIAWEYHTSSDTLQPHTNANRGYSSEIVLVPNVTNTSSPSVAPTRFNTETATTSTNTNTQDVVAVTVGSSAAKATYSVMLIILSFARTLIAH